MLTASFRRKTLLILLVAVLLTPVLSAAGPQTHFLRSENTVAPDFFSRIWSFLQKLQAKAGCEIDPSGCISQNPRPQPKEGCHIDPSGRCVP